MNLLRPKSVEEIVVTALISGQQTTNNLLLEVKKRKGALTKQGFYAALRKLKAEEVIVIYKKIVALNTAWIKDMERMISKVSLSYGDSHSYNNLYIQEKESVTYSFSSIKHLDAFWGHSQNILIARTSPQEPIFAYDPHYWFYIARRATEKRLLEEITTQGRQFLMTVGFETPMDKMIKKDFKRDLLQYNHKKIFMDVAYYVTVIDDYITEVVLDQKISDAIHALYMNNKHVTPEVMSRLESFLYAKAKNKIRISKNKTRAEKIKKRLAKDFYIIHNAKYSH
jgi:hypothetical protein